MLAFVKDYITGNQFLFNLAKAVTRAMGLATGEPTGFPDASEVAISFVNGTRTFTVEPVGDSFTFYNVGTPYIKESAESIVIDDTEGLCFIYYEGAILKCTTTFSTAIILDFALVAILYWDKDAQEEIYFANECHGTVMSGVEHLHDHAIFGALLESGGGLITMTVDGDGSSATHAQFGNEATEIWDEDIKFAFNARTSVTSLPIYYRSGVDGSNIWRMDESDSYPVLTADTGRAAWNELTGGSWQQTEVGNNDFVLAHVAVTNDSNRPFVVFQGQDSYNTKNAAREGALTEINAMILAGLPVAEFKFVATVILKTSDSYSNDVQSAIISTDTGDDYVDLTAEIITRGGVAPSAGVTVDAGTADNDFLVWDNTLEKWVKATPTEADAIIKADWEAKETDLGEKSGTVTITIDTDAGANQEVEIATSAVVTFAYSNFSATRPAVWLKTVNGGAATSIAYGGASHPNKTAPSLQTSGTDFLLIEQDIDDTMIVSVGNPNVGTV